jgi:hypothetical protein
VITQELKKNYVRMNKTVKENWGFPFITGFIMLLITAALFLTVGWASLAESIANFAYYSLVAGVLLELVCFNKNREKNGVAPSESS